MVLDEYSAGNLIPGSPDGDITNIRSNFPPYKLGSEINYETK